MSEAAILKDLVDVLSYISALELGPSLHLANTLFAPSPTMHMKSATPHMFESLPLAAFAPNRVGHFGGVKSIPSTWCTGKERDEQLSEPDQAEAATS